MTSYSQAQLEKIEVNIDWSQILADIPSDAYEAIICDDFVKSLLEELGFTKQEWVPSFRAGSGADKVDYAARKNSDGDVFKHIKTNPYLLIEALVLDHTNFDRCQLSKLPILQAFYRMNYE